MVSVLIDGVLSEMDESQLEKREGVIDTDHEYTTWVEYRRPGDDTIVHRSCHVTLKQWPDGMSGQVHQLG